MLWVLAAVELALWIYGRATGHRMGGVLNVLLVLAALAVITELGLRFRRARFGPLPSRKAAQRSNWRKAA